MLIKFTSDMDFVDFLEDLEDRDVVPTEANRDELEVKVDQDDLLETLSVESEEALATEVATLYGGTIEDWHDD